MVIWADIAFPSLLKAEIPKETLSATEAGEEGSSSQNSRLKGVVSAVRFYLCKHRLSYGAVYIRGQGEGTTGLAWEIARMVLRHGCCDVAGEIYLYASQLDLIPHGTPSR